MSGWLRTCSTRRHRDGEAKPDHAIAADTPAAVIRAPSRGSPRSATPPRRRSARRDRPRQQHDDTAVDHRTPAAVTAQLVSAAGTRRRSRSGLATVRGAHTWTCARSFSRRAGPMPSTSASWSTLVNGPLASARRRSPPRSPGRRPAARRVALPSRCSGRRSRWRRGCRPAVAAPGCGGSGRPNCPSSSARRAARRCRR